MLIDNCQFLSSEESLNVADRVSIALNATANDVKLRHNRAVRFRHFAVLGGTNNLVLGNHFFQGDSIAQGVRSAGLIMIGTYNSSTISENYIDNCYVQWTNERDAKPVYTSGFSFSSMTITDNIFYSSQVAPWFSFIVVRPYGAGHFLNGVVVTGNKFRSTSGSITRAERVDTTFANLNANAHLNVTFENNTFHGVTKKVANPLRLRHTQNSAAQAWTVVSDGQLPFGSKARGCDTVAAVSPLRNTFGSIKYATPYVELEQGGSGNQIRLRWPEALRGTVSTTIRMER